MIFIILLLLILICVLYLYWNAKNEYSYWRKRGVPGPDPTFPFGNVTENFLLKKSLEEIHTDIYNQYEDLPFVGTYRGTTPVLIVRDPNFIKNILIKDFKSFYNNVILIDKAKEPLLGRNPFFLADAEWKVTRTQLSPGFSGGKIKTLFPIVDAVAKELISYITNLPEATSVDGTDAKEVCNKFTMNNVSACAFGIDAKSFGAEKPEIRTLTEQVLPRDNLSNLIFHLVTMLIPQLSDRLNIPVVPTEVNEKLRDIVLDSVKYREEHNLKANDFLQFVMNLKDTTKGYTEWDMVGHVITFLFDGYETSASIMSFLLYELGSNKEAQETLRDEINKVLDEKYNGVFSYDAIQDLPYLEACIKETIRRNPAFVIQKTCTQPYTYESDGIEFKKMKVDLKPGDALVLPLRALHNDPKYFPQPEKFMPERMLNPEKINKYAFLPFGDGPRVCIGQRFAMLQMSIGIVHIVKNFHLSLGKKTRLPLVFNPVTFLTTVKHGLYVRFDKIK